MDREGAGGPGDIGAAREGFTEAVIREANVSPMKPGREKVSLESEGAFLRVGAGGEFLAQRGRQSAEA